MKEFLITWAILSVAGITTAAIAGTWVGIAYGFFKLVAE